MFLLHYDGNAKPKNLKSSHRKKKKKKKKLSTEKQRITADLSLEIRELILHRNILKVLLEYFFLVFSRALPAAYKVF